jgi:hypothetical protein
VPSAQSVRNARPKYPTALTDRHERILVVVERVQRRHGIEAGVGDGESSAFSSNSRTGTKGQHGRRDVEQNAFHAQVGQESGQGAMSAANIEDRVGPPERSALPHGDAHRRGPIWHSTRTALGQRRNRGVGRSRPNCERSASVVLERPPERRQARAGRSHLMTMGCSRTRSNSANAWSGSLTLIVRMPRARAGLRLTPRSSRNTDSSGCTPIVAQASS